ncbi:hypothetical protein DV737_g1033, partial [Chaetothyriales sp. CBS 132003]
MNVSSRLLRLARPKKFLGAMSLSTGAQLITLSLLSPLQCLALAWFYVLDSIINAVYTLLFAVSWFLVLTERTSPGADAAVAASDLVNAEHKVGSAQITGAPANNAVVTSVPATATAALVAAAGGGGSGQASRLQEAVLGTESINSIGIIIALWTVRLYFCIIMLGWARMIIRQHIASSGSTTTSYTTASTSPDLAENPFDRSKPEGQGWPGRAGRILISIGRSYWLGKDEDDSWMYNMKFKAATDTGIALNKIEAGPTERERRRRSGTGPPLPAPEVLGDGKPQQLSSDLEHLSTSYQRLRAAQARFRDCIVAIQKVQSTASAPHTPQLIPLTTSLYVPATPATTPASATMTASQEGEDGEGIQGGARGTVLVDVGTGFYVEKTYGQGVRFYEGKVADLEASLRTVEESVKGKTDTLRAVEDAMRRAVVAQQHPQQQEGRAKEKVRGAG